LDDAVIALDFDNAAAMRLQEWEDERAVSMNPFLEWDRPQVEFESKPMH